MSFEEWLESDATKEFRGLLAFDRMAKELARASWLASREAVEHRVQSDVCHGCGTKFQLSTTKKCFVCGTRR
jgi:hypothetical protein